ncbi:MAG: hypothetical protein ABR607_03340 [Pyrinomonadaceae bacterium]
MKRRSRLNHFLYLPSLITLVLACVTVGSAPAVPNPFLYLTKIRTMADKGVVRYEFDVSNKDAFPAEMFAPAPDLPPCGKNTKSSRTWLDFYTEKGKRLYGFCALTKPADLGSIWFELPNDTVPPSWVYIELNDRKTDTKYKSNPAETSQ